jgi:hypothetical protein
MEGSFRGWRVSEGFFSLSFSSFLFDLFLEIDFGFFGHDGDDDANYDERSRFVGGLTGHWTLDTGHWTLDVVHDV